jgi:hypothetical protein
MTEVTIGAIAYVATQVGDFCNASYSTDCLSNRLVLRSARHLCSRGRIFPQTRSVSTTAYWIYSMIPMKNRKLTSFYCGGTAKFFLVILLLVPPLPRTALWQEFERSGRLRRHRWVIRSRDEVACAPRSIIVFSSK